jgi:hypothetical protein
MPKNKREKVKNYMIFVSHSSADDFLAKFIKDRLEEKGKKHGLSVWLDSNEMESGDVVVKKFLDAIGKSDEFIILLSPNSVGSDWVKWEAGVAMGCRKRIIPLVFSVDTKDIPGPLVHLHRVDMNDFSRVIDEFVNRAKVRKNA